MTDNRPINFKISNELYDKLESLRIKRGRNATFSDVARDAFRAYVDQQEDVIGSRAHFNKSFQERLDKYQQEMGVQIDQETHKIIDAIIATARSGNPTNANNISLPDTGKLTTEIHLILELQLLCFTTLFQRLDGLRDTTPTKLLDTVITILLNEYPKLTAKIDQTDHQLPKSPPPTPK